MSLAIAVLSASFSLPADTEGKRGAQSPEDSASSFFIALGPSPRVQGGGAGEEGREGGMQGKTTCEGRRGRWGFSLNVVLLLFPECWSPPESVT